MILQNILTINYRSKPIGYLFTDIFIIAFIYFLPSLSHLTAIPFYLFEPMRLALVFCMVSTNRTNSLIIATTLPIISFLFSSHPGIAKSILISAELVINVILFYYLSMRMKNKFLVMLISILMAKIFYYASKFSLLSLGILDGDLVTTPLWIQYIVIFILSIYTSMTWKNKEELIFEKK